VPISDDKEAPKTNLEKRIPLTKAVLILVGTTVGILILGLIIGYNFFWNKYTRQTPIDIALQSSLHAVKETPTDAAAHLSLGYVYLVRGQAEQAIHHYRQAYSLNPQSRQVRYNLALGFIAIEEYEEAIELLKPLAEEGVLDFDTHFALGTAYLQSNKYTEAISAFEKALTIRSGAADAYYYIGQAYESLGDNEKALINYDNALRFVPTYPEFLEAKSRLTGKVAGGAGNGS